MYEKLLMELESLRKRTARFRRVALHLHSIDSHDWGAGETDNSLNDKSRFLSSAGRETFATELRKHLDLVAVTDHMRIGFASELSLEVGGSGDFVVLPGIEVNFRPDAALGLARIHLLVIFKEGSSQEVVGRLFEGQTHIPGDSQRAGNEEVTGLTLRDFVDRVHNNDGLCIAAHVEHSQGVRAVFRQTAKDILLFGSETDDAQQKEIGDSFKEYLLVSGLDAIEIHKPTDQKHYRWESKINNRMCSIPTVLRFDAHCVEHFARKERVIHLKMTRLGVAGLRDALMFSDTRIRFPSNLPSPPSPKLLGLQLSGEGVSFFQEVTLAFAENLNCIIGARGSGKSTIVEAIRYVLGYNRTLHQLDKLEVPIRELQRANLQGTLIRLVYETSSGQIRLLQATYDEKSEYITQVFTETGDPIAVPDVEKSGEFPLRLFGWSEIEMLGREPARQRELLDRLVPDLLAPMTRRDELRSALHSNRATIEKLIVELHGFLKQDAGQLSRYTEFTQDFNRLNTDQVKVLFGSLDLAKSKQSVLEKLRTNAASIRSDLIRVKGLSLDAELKQILAAGTDELRTWWLSQETQLLGLAAVQSQLGAAGDTALGQLAIFEALLDQHFSELSATMQNLEAELRKAFAADTSMQKIADLRANAQTRLRRATDLRNNYLKKWDALQASLGERDKIAQELEGVQNQIAGLRSRNNQLVESRLNNFLPSTMRVSIALQVGRDTKEFEEKLYGMYGARSSTAKKIKKIVPILCTPVSFARSVVAENFDGLQGRIIQVDGEDVLLTEQDIQQIVKQSAPKEHNAGAAIDTLVEDGKRLKDLLELQETPWDDHEAILLNGRPVNEKSPGQRSSAMLPLIALAEQTPLVIDQPEDNLDKKLIGDVLAKVLAELKENRQIIVCTHDPNILVGGDAEQVIVLEAESDRRAYVANHGSIDNDDIVLTVIDLLEGGKEAFEARRKRYGGYV